MPGGTSKLQQAQQVLQAIADYRHQKPAAPWDALYYELLAKYFDALLHARERGQFVATQSDLMPSEVVYAMDMVPFRLSMVCSTLGIVLREQETLLATAKAHGLPAEVCSVHRLNAGLFLRGWAPPVDAVIWDNEPCDSNAKSSELIVQLCGVPGFYIDCPYYFNEATTD